MGYSLHGLKTHATTGVIPLFANARVSKKQQNQMINVALAHHPAYSEPRTNVRISSVPLIFIDFPPIFCIFPKVGAGALEVALRFAHVLA
jgi:hypothetical protein